MSFLIIAYKSLAQNSPAGLITGKQETCKILPSFSMADNSTGTAKSASSL